MLLTQDQTSSYYFIKSYQSDKIIVNRPESHFIGEYNSSIIVSGNIIDNWPPQTLSALKAEHFDIIISQDPELVLIGTGKQHHFVDAGLLKDLITRRIGFEIMSTSAACRTYNVLISEGRHVVAGLLIQ